jgi:hypothetical protein
MTTLRVAACPATSVRQDGSLMEMDLEGQNKQRVTLQFDEAILDEVIGRSMQLLSEARNRRHAKTSQPGVSALPVAAAGAGPSANGNHVILVLKAHAGTEFQFAIPTHGAEQFARNIMTGVAAARQGQQPPQ